MLLLVTCCAAAVTEADAPPPNSTAQTLQEAWWTGPLLAASAATLPQGHLLMEPYLADTVATGQFNGHGTRISSAPRNVYGSFTYINYGVTDAISTAFIPRFAYVHTGAGVRSSSIGIGDMSLQAQYRLTQYSPAWRCPTISVVFTETLPTGKFDRLAGRPDDGVGEGAFTTEFSVYSQYYFWLPTGRILRTRFNVSYAWWGHVNIEGESVYGTPPGFRGTASPGGSASIDLAAEYSVSSNWVMALDFAYEHHASTRVVGRQPGIFSTTASQDDSRPSEVVVLAPALEYNWNAKVGVIVGARVTAWGRSTLATVTPVAALNLFF